jgi:hypothetical protein
MGYCFGSPLRVGFLIVAIAAAANANPIGRARSAAAEYSSAITEVDELPQLRPDFPRPTDSNLLFYIQHSSSPNTVVYTANIDPNGQLDPRQPIDVYWRRFTNGGERVPLSFFERLFAYGVKVHSSSPENNAMAANIVSYPQRVINIDFDDQAKPRATIEMGNHYAKLIYVYLAVDESRLIPSVLQVDVFGRDIADGQVLHEVIKPAPAPKY